MNYGKIKKVYNEHSKKLSLVLGVFTRFIPLNFMYGKTFRGFFNYVNKSQFYSRKVIEADQNKKLRKLIEHAYNNVPYYKRIFDERNLKPGDIKTKKDLKKIPILTKTIVRKEFDSLLAKNYRDFVCSVETTSGSTGAPFRFYLDQKSREKEYALVWRQLHWAGIKFDDKIANFRGELLNRDEKVLWEYHALKKELCFSTFKMNPTNMGVYLKKLMKFKPKLIRGYPSALYLLGRYVIKYDLKIKGVKCIQTSSELLSKKQREIIETAFQCKIFDWYGSSEYVVSAGECEMHNGYHLNDDMSIIELVEKDKTGKFEIVGTSLYNYSMPLIRYAQEDLTTLSKKKCACGRGLTLIKSIDGRLSDVLMTTKGVIIPATTYAIFWEKNIYLEKIEYVQTVQKADNKLLIKMVKRDGLSVKERDLINTTIRRLLGEDMIINYEFLDDVPKNIKWRFSKSEILKK